MCYVLFYGYMYECVRSPAFTGLEATGELHRSARSLYDRLKGVLDEAKGVWHVNHF